MQARTTSDPVTSRPGWTQGLRARAALLGPALVAAVAYVDPGNVATNVSAGASYGYLLVWVVVSASLVAVLVQYLAAKLGLATGRSLAWHSAQGSRPKRTALGLQAVAVALATDLAEVVGGALALKLLVGMPLLAGALLTGLVSTLVLLLGRDARVFERTVTAMLLLVALGFVYSALVAGPDPVGILHGSVPRLDGADSLLLAVGMLGATVMPHAIYAHSSLVLERFEITGPPAHGEDRRGLLRATRLDVALALATAGVVNLSLLVLAAAALGGSGIDTIEGAHAGVSSTLGPAVATFFALALLFSGLASASVGTYAGSVILDGFLVRKVSLTLRRLVTLVPAVVVLALGVDPTKALVVSQVVLSFGLPFAIVPLVRLTSSRRVMGPMVNSRTTTTLAVLAAVAVSGLNVALLVMTAL